MTVIGLLEESKGMEKVALERSSYLMLAYNQKALMTAKLI